MIHGFQGAVKKAAEQVIFKANPEAQRTPRQWVLYFTDKDFSNIREGEEGKAFGELGVCDIDIGFYKYHYQITEFTFEIVPGFHVPKINNIKYKFEKSKIRAMFVNPKSG